LIATQQRIASAELRARPMVQAQMANVSVGVSPSPGDTTFDWSKHDVVGSVKDQDLCGSCWNFAAVGVLEAMYAIRFGKEDLLDLSEEQWLRCNMSAFSCCGGWWPFDDMKRGVVGESRLPYTSGTIRCVSPNPPRISRAMEPCPVGQGGRLYKVATWGYVGSSEGVPPTPAIKEALCQHGPLIASVRVTDAFQNYTGGFFNERAAGDINHAIIIVGWTQRGWIVRNSWGPGWGQNGYIEIAFNSNSIGFGAAWVEPERSTK